MVASDRWETASGWYEVLTVNAVDLAAVSEMARQGVDAIERACSPALPEAEAGRLSCREPQPISRLLAQAVSAARRAEAFSQGLVPVTVPTASGDDSETASMPGDTILDEDGQTLTLPGGHRLELWPIARAWAADRIAEACNKQLGIGCLINLGGDIAVSGELPTNGWRIEIEDGQPTPTGLDTITMSWPGGLASAEAPAPRWPEVGPSPPPRHWRSATVAAHSCERAKAACLTSLAMGDDAPRWLTQRELPARLVHTGGITVQTPGWPAAS
jgi:FAD:protein FMN transferase